MSSSVLFIAARTLLATLWASRATKLLLGAGVLLLAAVAVGSRAQWIDPGTAYGIRTSLLVPGLPLVAVSVGELPLRDGLTQRTLLYPLLGPVPRSLLCLVRTVMAALLLCLGMSALVLLLRPFSYAPTEGLGRELGAVALGSLCYLGLFGLLHVLTKHGLVTGLGFALGDYLLGKVPFSMRGFAPAAHLANLADISIVDTHGLPLSVSPIALADSVLVLALVALVAGALTVWRFTRMDLPELC
jgi:hypothetical protein